MAVVSAEHGIENTHLSSLYCICCSMLPRMNEVVVSSLALQKEPVTRSNNKSKTSNNNKLTDLRRFRETGSCTRSTRGHKRVQNYCRTETLPTHLGGFRTNPEAPPPRQCYCGPAQGWAADPRFCSAERNLGSSPLQPTPEGDNCCPQLQRSVAWPAEDLNAEMCGFFVVSVHLPS